MTSAYFSGLFATAPGPASVQQCWQSGAVRHPVLTQALDAATARRLYKVNRTPAAEAAGVIEACQDGDFLHDVALRERRRTLAHAALRHPCVKLETLIDAYCGEARSGTPDLFGSSRYFARAAARHVAAHGLAATVTLLLEAGPPAAVRCDEAIELLDGLVDDMDQVRRVLTHGGLEYIGAVAAQVVARPVSDELLTMLVTEAPITAAVPVVCDKELDRSHPHLVDALYTRCRDSKFTAVENGGYSAVHGFVLWLASRPQRDERFCELAALGRSAVLEKLAVNPHVSCALIASWKVPRDVIHARAAGMLTGRVLAERMGDDAAAFQLAGSLLGDFIGTYAQLVDTVQATLA